MAQPGSSGWRRWTAVALACALAAILPTPTTALATGDGAHASIVGGTPASIFDFPSLAFIVTRNESSCTGTVISPRVVLTAAHCVQDLDVGGFTAAEDYAVVTGRANPRQAGTGNVLRVSETHLFPRFDPGTGHGDAALLVLASPTPAPAIPLATSADGAIYQGGAEVFLAGWGLTHPDATSASEILRSTANVVLSPGSCKSRTRPYNPTYSKAVQMCTTDPPDHRSGGCFGDSGGPVIARRADGSPVEIGIVSTGGPRCSTKLPNIFTRADLISAWALEWVAAIESGGPPPSLRARLPRLTQESAEEFVGRLLRTTFGRLFLQSQGLQGGCRRLGPPRMKCELVWRYGPKIYFGTVTVFYALRQNTVAWDNSYVVRRAGVRCLRSNRSQSCPVETRRG